MSGQFLEQGLGVAKVDGGEAFSEPVVQRGKQIPGVFGFPLIAPESAELVRCAQLQRLGTLVAGDGQRALIVVGS